MTFEQSDRQARGMAPLNRVVPVIESRTERAAHAVYGAAADFVLAISDANTSNEALRLSRMLEPLISVLTSTQKKALDKAEEL